MSLKASSPVFFPPKLPILLLLLYTRRVRNSHFHSLSLQTSSSSSYLPSSSLLLLHSCQNLRRLKQIHASLVVSTGFDHVSVASKLICLYSQFNELESSVFVFNALRNPCTMLWNLVIKSHVDSGLFDFALRYYRKMRDLGVKHDHFTFPIINKAISSLQFNVVCVEMVHCVAVRIGFDSDFYFCNTMIEALGKCGCLSHARKLFDEMSHRDLISWTSMISAYASEGDIVCSFDLFSRMRREVEVEPNSVTMMVMIQSCYQTESFLEGKQLHGYVLKNGLLFDNSLKNLLLGMYTGLGSVDEVEVLYSETNGIDVVSCNILMSFYFFEGDIAKVLSKFSEMLGGGVTLSIETLTTVISAIAKYGNLSQGETLHCLASKTGLYDDILNNSLLDLYSKFGELGESVRLFREISCRNVIMWSTMMSGFVQNGYFNEAVEFFIQTRDFYSTPSTGILKNLVDAYVNLGALLLGKGIHGYIIRNYISDEEYYLHLETSVLNMYIKCGSISSARVCFNSMSIKDVVTWTSMIEGCGTYGQGFDAIDLFNLMTREGIAPNKTTLLSLLSACSHSGLINEGCQVFNSMRSSFDIKPDLEHYTCIVDLLGRSGKLKEALVIILKMVGSPDSRIWGALLGACRVHGDTKIGGYSGKRLMELEPDNIGYHTLLSNTQANVGEWDQVEELRREMNEKELKKKPGWSFIEVKGMIHGFVLGDRSHDRVEEIYKILECLSRGER